MKPPSIKKHQKEAEQKITHKDLFQKKASEEIAKFEKTMEELKLLKYLSQDLKNYRKMIKLKKFD